MAKYQSRADLLIAAGESIKMQEKAGVNEPLCKTDGVYGYLYFLLFDKLSAKRVDYEFPLSVVEGKPVFVGDELYDSVGHKFKIIALDADRGNVLINCSWNPPKPATVMVELPLLIVEWNAKYMHGELASACRKALEK